MRHTTATVLPSEIYCGEKAWEAIKDGLRGAKIIDFRIAKPGEYYIDKLSRNVEKWVITAQSIGPRFIVEPIQEGIWE